MKLFIIDQNELLLNVGNSKFQSIMNIVTLPKNVLFSAFEYTHVTSKRHEYASVIAL